jgi:transcription antitermination factor NusG
MWYAIQARTRWERSTASLLSEKGYEVLLPTYESTRRQGDRTKKVSYPLFPGYLFCRFDVQKRLPILITPGVIAVVGQGRNPISVEESEMSAIQTIVSSGTFAEPWPYLQMGQKVRVEDHPLRGVEGILIGYKGSHRIVISVTLLRRSIALEIERSRVVPIHPARETAIDTLPARLLNPVVA